MYRYTSPATVVCRVNPSHALNAGCVYVGKVVIGSILISCNSLLARTVATLARSCGSSSLRPSCVACVKRRACSPWKCSRWLNLDFILMFYSHGCNASALFVAAHRLVVETSCDACFKRRACLRWKCSSWLDFDFISFRYSHGCNASA